MGFNIEQLGSLLVAMLLVFNLSSVGFAQHNDNNEINSFFQSFDINKNNKLEWNEASNFYTWVQKNVKYRYDDESITNSVKNTLVGDGRYGDDYQQSVLETYYERAGDCEDQNGLQVAFFRYWGYESKLGVVKIKDNDFHAVALVKVDDMKPLSKISKNVFYYTIESRNPYGLSPGKYIVVDNTYGKRIGEIAQDKILDTTLIQTLQISN